MGFTKGFDCVNHSSFAGAKALVWFQSRLTDKTPCISGKQIQETCSKEEVFIAVEFGQPWFKEEGLLLNPDKTCYLIFRTKKKSALHIHESSADKEG